MVTLVSNDPLDNEEYILEDTICPHCFEKISPDSDFCICGFNYKAYKKSSQYSFAISIIIIITVAIWFLATNNIMSNLNATIAEKLGGDEVNSITSPHVYVENKLINSGYGYLIMDIHSQDRDHRNVLVIAIKPEYWRTLDKHTKTNIYNMALDLWKSSYKGDNATVRFANAH